MLPVEYLSIRLDFVEYPLDRWNFKTNSPESNHVFVNYLGFGTDAAVSLRFHRMRKSFPWLFFYQPINIIWYVFNILLEAIYPTKRNLHELGIDVDGKSLDLTPYRSIVVLNIPYFCGGGTPLGTDFTYSQCNDGEIEVIGFKGIVHILSSKFGLTRAHLLAKGKHITWKLENSFPVQADGEPWIQKKSEGTISLYDKVTMLVDSVKGVQEKGRIGVDRITL